MATSEYAGNPPLAPPKVAGPRPEIAAHGVRDRPRGWLSWLSTTDHKKIGLLYIYSTFVFFMLGGVEALMMRLQLSVADNTLIHPPTYNALVTIHGSTMVVLFFEPPNAGWTFYAPLSDNAFNPGNGIDAWIFLIHLTGL